ncbi:ABC transporter ATP-binding protein [Microvirga makkahensis]|uniref:ATP-binding cassette domain-containing protein n=1 Tax=Microvirga makkahensis TaxID=1128670 RepID=A0A7X3SQ33_9HYPH|nr:oligopeptide/dipeptide ABC transporter ATP-binding protein [Microvirga makkahensis]MXQ13146.1 ATP-binding cassette domain-containing protein [Microvirga makkahensis]
MTATTSSRAAVPLPAPGSATPMLELSHLTKRFTTKLDFAERLAKRLGAKVQEFDVRAVDDVSLAIAPGEVVGLVGESGCGKTTLGRMVAGIIPPSSGELIYRGRPMAALPHDEARQATLKIQMVFQDPMASLNPRLRVSEIIGEAPRVHGIVSRNEQADYVASIMRKVGLDPAYAARFPHQFSGGQRQRIGIARALAVQPDFLVCDESVAALDVSIQAQIINLFMELRRDLGLTYLFISHDLGVVEHIADRTVIMYLGRVVEVAPSAELFTKPNHPYSRALLDEAPRVDTRKRTFAPIRGEIPSPLDPPAGCAFHPRCPLALPRCRSERPSLREIAPGRLSACHLNDMQ